MAVAGPGRVLVVDDERSMRELLSIVLRRDGYDVLVAEDGAAALDVLTRERVDILITDIRMPKMNGVDLLREAKRIAPDIISIVMTAFASTDTAVEALRLGAADYVNKSPSAASEAAPAGRAGAGAQAAAAGERPAEARAAARTHQFSNIIGTQRADAGGVPADRDDRPDEQHRAHHRASPAPARSSSRARFTSTRRARIGRSSRVNCGALSETLLDSELFGHMRGAFTGRGQQQEGPHRGRREGHHLPRRDRGDEPAVQVKLLRVLQERKFRRVGGTEEIDADIRVIAATNRDLAKMVADGTFREDLFYRINVIPMRLPPLRERLDDIPLLAEHFVAKFAEQMGKPSPGFRAARWRGCASTAGRATSASSRTRSSGPWRSNGPRDSGREPAGTAHPAGRPWLRPRRRRRRGRFPDAGFDLEQHVQHIERE